ncbi:single-stranded DNA-binding protein [[Clostridium] innocuum]|uniref:single-stranded DNA-binding protein n=1 Tax=Clostridium innocuum TaxID=1522 RepID=UPI0022DFC33A|nr:single-stranded DNA-binding protein [[Clostridium] innocuum]
MRLFMISGRIKDIRTRISATQRSFLNMHISSSDGASYEISMSYEQLLDNHPLEVGDSVMAKGQIVSHESENASGEVHLSYEFIADHITRY